MKTEIDFLRELEADFEALALDERAPARRPVRATRRPAKRVLALSSVAVLILAGVIGYHVRQQRQSTGIQAGWFGYAPQLTQAERARLAFLPPPPSAQPGPASSPAHAGATVAQQLVKPPLVGPQIVKTAQMTLVVKKGRFDSAFQQASLVASRYAGYIDSSSTAGGDAKSGRLRIRVPARSFERALQELRALGTVEAESVSGQDVTADYVDLQARIRTWEAQESVLLQLMSQASTVADTLRVQRELQDVQLTIERLKGQLRVLNDQTENSTIALSLREEGAVARKATNAAPWLPSFGEAWRDTVRGFLGVAFSVVIGLGYLIPIGILALMAWFGYRRLRVNA
jgi:uncharacterized protein DUF4349